MKFIKSSKTLQNLKNLSSVKIVEDTIYLFFEDKSTLWMQSKDECEETNKKFLLFVFHELFRFIALDSEIVFNFTKGYLMMEFLEENEIHPDFVQFKPD